MLQHHPASPGRGALDFGRFLTGNSCIALSLSQPDQFLPVAGIEQFFNLRRHDFCDSFSDCGNTSYCVRLAGTAQLLDSDV